MLIYKGTSDAFIDDVKFNRIADIMKENFFDYTGHRAGIGEYRSWQNSLNHVKNVLEVADLHDNMIELEYQIPYNSNRIDCLIFGEDESREGQVVLIELKQWDHVDATDIDGNYVETYVGKGIRLVAHPSQQVQGYHHYLMNFVEEFEKEPPFKLTSFAYCHNYSRDTDSSGLFADQYADVIEEITRLHKENSDKVEAFEDTEEYKSFRSELEVNENRMLELRTNIRVGQNKFLEETDYLNKLVAEALDSQAEWTSIVREITQTLDKLVKEGAL
jgi:hypothetical protein